MYFKNKKQFKKIYYNKELDKPFLYYDFNVLDRILELGELIQKFYQFGMFFHRLIIKIENHQDYKPSKRDYDYETGFISGTLTPVNNFLTEIEIKEVKKIIRDINRLDLLGELVRLSDFFRENRNILNIKENLKIFEHENEFDIYIETLRSLEREFLEVWDGCRQHFDKINDKITIPEPNEANKYYFEDLLEIKDIFALGYYRTALLVLGRTTEEILKEIGNLSIELIAKYPDWEDGNKHPLEDRTNILFKNQNLKMFDDDAMYRNILSIIKYRHKGGHPLKRVEEFNEIIKDVSHILNIGITVINKLCIKLKEERDKKHEKY